MTFGEALRAARKGAKASQAWLARQAGVTQGAVTQVETGRRPGFARQTVAKIERALALPPGELARHLPPEHAARQLAETEVPDMGTVWGARVPPDVPEPEPGKTYRLTARFPAGTFVLRVSGHSVHRYGVHDGDVIAVRPTEQEEDGALVVLRQGNAYTLKGCRGGRLFSFGPDEAEPVEMADGDPYQVVGVMIGLVGGERRFTPRSKTRPRPKKA